MIDIVKTKTGIDREAAIRRSCQAIEWLVLDDIDNSVFAWLRKGRHKHDRCLVVVNFTPQLHRDYRVPITQSYKLFHALKDFGVTTQFVAYPISGHNARPIRPMTAAEFAIASRAGHLRVGL